MIQSFRKYAAQGMAAIGIVAMVTAAGACGGADTSPAAAPSAQSSTPATTSATDGDTAQRPIDAVTLSVGGREFAMALADNATAQAFAAMLPLDGLQMSELNGNEKYHRFDHALPTDPTTPATIKAGDVMLYQDDCLVVFYADHANPGYQYTRIGTIADVDDLAGAVGSGSATMSFTAAN